MSAQMEAYKRELLHITCRHGESQPRRGLPCTQRMCHHPHQSLCASAVWTVLLQQQPAARSVQVEAQMGLAGHWEPHLEEQLTVRQCCLMGAVERWTGC